MSLKLGSAPIDVRIDVEDDQLVDFLLVEDSYRVDRVADVLAVLELNRFDQPPVPHRVGKE